MKYMNFAGHSASVLALGTMDFGGKIERGRAFELLDTFAALGGNHIDTARMYGDFKRGIQGGSEQVIGQWIEVRGNRGKILLATKGAFPGEGNAPRLSREDILTDIRMSLDALRTDCVDLYYLHRDDPGRDMRDIAETLSALVERGFARHVAVSNWRPARIRALLACARAHGLAEISANQLQFSLARQTVVEDATLVQMDAESYALHREEKSLACVCFSSQAKGFLQKLATVGAEGLSDKVRRRFYHPENLRIYEKASALAQSAGCTVGAVALAYLLRRPFPCCPVVGASSTAQLAEAMAAVDVNIPADALDALRPDLF